MNENVIVKENEFDKPLIHKVDSIIDTCVRDITNFFIHLIIIKTIILILVQILLYKWITIVKYVINISTTKANICILNQNQKEFDKCEDIVLSILI